MKIKTYFIILLCCGVAFTCIAQNKNLTQSNSQMDANWFIGKWVSDTESRMNATISKKGSGFYIEYNNYADAQYKGNFELINGSLVCNKVHVSLEDGIDRDSSGKAEFKFQNNKLIFFKKNGTNNSTEVLHKVKKFDWDK